MLLILFLALKILLNVNAHVFIIFNDHLLPLNQSEPFLFQYLNHNQFWQIFSLDKYINVIYIHCRKGGF